MTQIQKLAIDGGPRAIPEPLPTGMFGLELIDEEEVQAAAHVLRSKKLFRFWEGNDQSDLFEDEACAWLGARHAIFVNSGTAALTCALAGLEIGPGDEVIVPGYTYIATASAVIGLGAVPVIAEIDDSLSLDPADVEAKLSERTRAIIAVHMQGVPGRLGELRAIARGHGVALVEDCCQAIGSRYHGVPTGVASAAGTWSLNAFKGITCGEGGLLYTNDDLLFERALLQSDPAMPMWPKAEREWHTAPFSRAGYRGNEITAAIARVQLRKLDRILAHCRGLKRQLLGQLDPQPRHYRRQHVDDPKGDAGFSFTMLANSVFDAQELARALEAEGLPVDTVANGGIPNRYIYANWDAIVGEEAAAHPAAPWNQPAYQGEIHYSPTMCPRTLDLLERTLKFTIHLNLREQHIEQIAAAINKVDTALD